MRSSSVLLLTISIGLCLSLYNPVANGAPMLDLATTVDNPRHLVQRREVAYRPLFVYRQQEIEKQGRYDANEQHQRDHQDYKRQLQDYKQQMEDYKHQLHLYKQRKQHLDHHDYHV
ncbi:uncharacterized protein LOC129722299 [Wyeomyia smithii]|uniref:uncharacterized protein LOC129722299 n=1 Tax=Wyeomyia smithii TaxID=174621 RepID=UPI0024682066|nr:uncharacterized protein LOC129722299 [Wyeomyia smithii]